MSSTLKAMAGLKKKYDGKHDKTVLKIISSINSAKSKPEKDLALKQLEELVKQRRSNK